jgi:hypothetical protein
MITVTSSTRTLAVDVGRLSQSWQYTELLEVTIKQAHEHRLRVRIKYDAYRDQSSARIERWDGAEWREVYSLTTGLLRGWTSGLYVRKDIDATAFALDRSTLLERALVVLS